MLLNNAGFYIFFEKIFSRFCTVVHIIKLYYVLLKLKPQNARKIGNFDI